MLNTNAKTLRVVKYSLTTLLKKEYFNGHQKQNKYFILTKQTPPFPIHTSTQTRIRTLGFISMMNTCVHIYSEQLLFIYKKYLMNYYNFCLCYFSFKK